MEVPPLLGILLELVRCAAVNEFSMFSFARNENICHLVFLWSRSGSISSNFLVSLW